VACVTYGYDVIKALSLNSALKQQTHFPGVCRLACFDFGLLCTTVLARVKPGSIFIVEPISESSSLDCLRESGFHFTQSHDSHRQEKSALVDDSELDSEFGFPSSRLSWSGEFESAQPSQQSQIPTINHVQRNDVPQRQWSDTPLNSFHMPLQDRFQPTVQMPNPGYNYNSQMNMQLQMLPPQTTAEFSAFYIIVERCA